MVIDGDEPEAASASVTPVESIMEAILRLQALLPPEPDAAAPADPVSASGASRIVRVQLRLPPAASPVVGLPSSTGTPAVPPAPSALTKQRRFLSSAPLSVLFDWATLSWLQASATGTDTGSDVAPSSGGSLAKRELPVRPFTLQVAGLPPRSILPTGEVRTGTGVAQAASSSAGAAGGAGVTEPTIASVLGASQSASLTLQPE